jgi:hypothetical protein
MRRWIDRMRRIIVGVAVLGGAAGPVAAQDGGGLFPAWSVPVTFASGADLSTSPSPLWSGSMEGAVLRRLGPDATWLVGGAAAATHVRGIWRPAGGGRVATCLVCVRDAGLYLQAEALVGSETLPLSAGAVLDIPVRQAGFLHVGVRATYDTRQRDWSTMAAVGTDLFRWRWHP